MKQKEQKEPSLEERFACLEEMIKQLENPDIALEESFRLYQEGMELLKLCNNEIDKVEKKVLLLNEAGETDEL
ncbi:MAG TPA: exodeoxyribonuclease VII small subunit [Lachnospiraceae bacterium]|nr:exodeoxyribonuclease VII small subunit [Lachnospiraceae bacterium]HPF30092.1 exodeoxyribonuclease VII small subunit [Lachnospiraceae bacterium]